MPLMSHLQSLIPRNFSLILTFSLPLRVTSCSSTYIKPCLELSGSCDCVSKQTDSRRWSQEEISASFSWSQIGVGDETLLQHRIDEGFLLFWKADAFSSQKSLKLWQPQPLFPKYIWSAYGCQITVIRILEYRSAYGWCRIIDPWEPKLHRLYLERLHRSQNNQQWWRAVGDWGVSHLKIIGCAALCAHSQVIKLQLQGKRIIKIHV